MSSSPESPTTRRRLPVRRENGEPTENQEKLPADGKKDTDMDRDDTYISGNGTAGSDPIQDPGDDVNDVTDPNDTRTDHIDGSVKQTVGGIDKQNGLCEFSETLTRNDKDKALLIGENSKRGMKENVFKFPLSDYGSTKCEDTPDNVPIGQLREGRGDGCGKGRGGVWYIPRRYIVTLLLGLGMLLVYAQRTNLGVTVVMILDVTAHEKVDTLEIYHTLPRLSWSSQKVGLLHASFYIGFLVTQLPGAYLTSRWPSHKLFGGCILISALLNLLLPVCIDRGQFELTCIIRAAQGASEGLLYPSCYAFLRHWSAPSERSRQVSIVLTCAYAGAIIGFPAAGLITNFLGWQYIFYIFGSACVMWYLVWLCFSYEKPAHHTSMSESEFNFMLHTQGGDSIDYENVNVPISSILKSLPVLAICFCHFTRHWVFTLMLTNEPLYLNQFGFNIAETGILAAIPHVAKVMMAFTSGIIADSLINSAVFTTTVVRKLLTCGALSVLALCFIILTLLSEGTPVIIVLTLALAFFGLSTSGWGVNHYDLSTRYASVLVAVTSTFGTTGAVIVPLAVGALTESQDLASWNNVFYLTAGIVLFAAMFFLAFGSGEKQPWSDPPATASLVQKADPLAVKPYIVTSLTTQKTTPLAVDSAVTAKSLGPGTVSAQQLDGQ